MRVCIAINYKKIKMKYYEINQGPMKFIIIMNDSCIMILLTWRLGQNLSIISNDTDDVKLIIPCITEN